MGDYQGHPFRGNQWTVGGATVAPADGDDRLARQSLEVIRAAATLPESSFGERPVPSPFPVVNEPKINLKKAPVRMHVRVADLRASTRQDKVFPERVRRYIGPQQGRLYVIKTPAGYVVGDGLHRATAAWLRGDISVEADVAQMAKGPWEENPPKKVR